MSDEPLLTVEDLRVHFPTSEGPIRAVDGVSFQVDRGETVCLVGESGSGKTVTCEALTQLTEGDIVDGSVMFDGFDLASLPEKRLRSYRGDRIAHVFQNPQSALDPVYTVGDQLAEVVGYHRDVTDREARDRAVDLLDRVGIPRAAVRADDYPHEFSGGMKQRVVVAMALASDPDLLVADEPTTALDVTVEAGVLDLLADLQAERDMAVLFVTHDLGVVAEIADRVVVMYAGKVMEQGRVHAVFEDPGHPYTRALMRCLPGQGRAVEPIGGSLPDPSDPPSGCRFHPRCPHAEAACKGGDQPPLYPVDGGGSDATGVTGGEPAGVGVHRASCVYYDEYHEASELAMEPVTTDATGGDEPAREESG